MRPTRNLHFTRDLQDVAIEMRHRESYERIRSRAVRAAAGVEPAAWELDLIEAGRR
ncbi:hypothetical protein PBI_KRATIO_86 [Mycobacterium phage Kratio]|nr:hypothetical protein CL76_gp17 [Mycobacterium phage Larva]YP_009212832.1 hypothetical protein PBI_KRATIO_86 [Mycobacterium phage Kratio]ASM62592.1 hypothetical protein SEA_ALLEYCAT_86 [Mycobacterium phage AlleyCat]QQV92686.1 hypothetical protein SEA_PSYCHO_84 [Mycobacterium phage Psycho]WAB09767.1 hypothetical protein SEA_DADOSKY_86 [Mycobacterium phage Dadosky]AEL19733.1 hypothetical protein LARVA_85 [Mycobacterium phage Larva]AJK27415.1 hypothetical protein PBI_KRATIO_86 [Mycobacterium p